MSRATLLAACLLLAAAGQGTAAAPAAAAAAAAAERARGTREPQLLLSGRFSPGPSGSSRPQARLPQARAIRVYREALRQQLMTWGASSATVRFSGASGVSVELDGRQEAAPAAHAWVYQTRKDLPAVFFQFEMGGQVEVGEVSKASPMLTWTKAGLAPGADYTLTITRLTEPRYGAVWLRAVNLTGAGAGFLAPAPPPGARSGRRMLFIGDSYTAGAANTSPEGATCKSADAKNSNVWLAWGPVAARALQADHQTLGWSASLLNIYRYTAGDSFPPELRRAYWPRLRDYWRRADALDPASRYPLASWAPQVVVLAGGTNDFANASLAADFKVASGALGALPPMQQWAAEYEAYVREVAAAYPRAIIVSLVYPLEQQLVGVRTPEQTLAYLQYMAAAGTRFQAAGLRNVYTLMLDGSTFPNTNWCRFHPDAASHALIAQQVAAFVRRVVPGWARP